ncbi:expressed protein [Phakopsora pachyrhizi]|uniref:Expressed protein n=1 Tax=Phakopsora pachyrhizi TaxID=170000 RepID=A0AAV0ASA8_PHAPC|nr:expressed protein [Phakopsora pachyrhizi]
MVCLRNLSTIVVYLSLLIASVARCFDDEIRESDDESRIISDIEEETLPPTPSVPCNSSILPLITETSETSTVRPLSKVNKTSSSQIKSKNFPTPTVPKALPKVEVHQKMTRTSLSIVSQTQLPEQLNKTIDYNSNISTSSSTLNSSQAEGSNLRSLIKTGVLNGFQILIAFLSFLAFLILVIILVIVYWLFKFKKP